MHYYRELKFGGSHATGSKTLQVLEIDLFFFPRKEIACDINLLLETHSSINTRTTSC